MSRTRRLYRSVPQFADRLSLGGQGLAVSPFGVGLVGVPETIGAAFDAGINFFFLTADMHWPYYEASRRGLELLLARGNGVRDRIVVAAVCYPTQPEFCYGPFQELLHAVPGLDRLDVLIAGGVYAGEFAARLPVYQQHRRTRFLGARAIGATFHDRQEARKAVTDGLVDVAFVRYNPAHAGAREDLFPHLPETTSPLLFGFKSTFGYVPPERMTELGLPGDVYWHPAITDHYRFALSRPELDGLLIGPATPKEVAALADAMKKGPLDEEEETYLMHVALVARGQARVEPEEQEARAC
jgi:predicted aldo/keto reductase-like oxidoreductase